ncbi:hypothetical protein FHS43_005642 [Streptosporangium becharense]|uniref:Red chlorophyll catabolite reductase n=1 Tax=Streptosporangium becharense TaxID=1816182 RepID=A0A7W9IMU3_9ACTN|nr:hypothetical protein [Streptosporangium becharense]MBB2914330.1 hypothetical protein [Streptosporangium becharense]MBB5823638.1 hypothetical protein [Streptosporangium becharense]
MSLPAALSERVLGRLLTATGLSCSADVELTAPMSPASVGALRVFRPAVEGRDDARRGPARADDGQVAKAVTVSLAVPAIGLDSHMIFVFTRPESAVPHFTLDAVASAGYHAMHLDLIPRVELATHLAYLDAVHLPLTPLLEAAWEIDGVSPAAVGPRQRAMMSPWMLVCRATEDAFDKLGPTVDAYLDHWLTLLDRGVPATADTDLAARDAVNRANLFSPDVDPVWHRITGLLGAGQTDRIRRELLS